jgi:multidrug resistance efflux pump
MTTSPGVLLPLCLLAAVAMAIHADHFPTPLPSTQSAPITHVSTPVAAAVAGSFIQAGSAS